jgi:type III restriction enzyme
MSAGAAFSAFWTAKNIPLTLGEHYHDTLGGVPNDCVKVPTGDGKTFIASSAIAPIFESLPFTTRKAVVWLVPSESILEQTLANLKNSEHPYRERLNTDFQHRVDVYEKAELLNGQSFFSSVVARQLSVFVLSYDSFRSSKKRRTQSVSGERKSCRFR